MVARADGEDPVNRVQKLLETEAVRLTEWLAVQERRRTAAMQEYNRLTVEVECDRAALSEVREHLSLIDSASAVEIEEEESK